MNRKWFKAKDIKNILGVTSGQLFHWKRWNLIEPEIKGEGRAHKDLYSFQNLIDIALVKQLTRIGIDPSRMESLRHLRKENVNLYKWAKKWKAEGHNYFVIFYLSEGEITMVTTGSEEFIIKSLRGNLPGENIPPVIISVNISEILRELEKRGINE